MIDNKTWAALRLSMVLMLAAVIMMLYAGNRAFGGAKNG